VIRNYLPPIRRLLATFPLSRLSTWVSAIAAPGIARFTFDPNHRESKLRLCCSRIMSFHDPFLGRFRLNLPKTPALSGRILRSIGYRLAAWTFLSPTTAKLLATDHPTTFKRSYYSTLHTVKSRILSTLACCVAAAPKHIFSLFSTSGVIIV